jgi:hypothetical protein
MKGSFIHFIRYKVIWDNLRKSKFRIDNLRRTTCTSEHIESNSACSQLFKVDVTVQTCLFLLSDDRKIEASCPYFEHLVRKIKIYHLQYLRRVIIIK